jgi:hypothetical protein
MTAETQMGRPRHTSDGVVLDGIVHGKKHGYNQGCRCIPCTEANREATRARREREEQ